MNNLADIFEVFRPHEVYGREQRAPLRRLSPIMEQNEEEEMAVPPPHVQNLDHEEVARPPVFEKHDHKEIARPPVNKKHDHEVAKATSG